jgi:Ser/Thr protein kinase RdoA (MazF antagonist)
MTPSTSVLGAYVLQHATIHPLGAGNINHTFLLESHTEKYVLQAINQAVFKNPEVIDANLTAIRDFLASHYPDYSLPTPLPNQAGATLTWDTSGTPWRLLPYVNDTHTYSVAPTADHAYAAAWSFADFSAKLSTLPPSALQPTIPDFHNLTKREAELATALTDATNARREAAADVITGLAQFRYVGEQYRTLITSGVWHTRIYHHDTKLTNILFTQDTPTVAAIIDLDTTMPGYVFSDVGDLLMFGTSVFEDELDQSEIVVDIEKYRAILAGYRAGSSTSLTPEESALLPQTPLIMCYMLALRFLADYLTGEVYFKTNYPGQNLDKARNRLTLLRAFAALAT